MKHIHKGLALALLLVAGASLLADDCCNSVSSCNTNSGCGGGIITHINPRSLSFYLPRLMVEEVDIVKRFDMEKFNGAFAVTPGYQQSFRNGSLTRALFGNSLQNSSDCGGQINISGSQVANRGSCDWLADYFGLGPNFQSSVAFSPKIKTFFIDFDLYVGLDEWVSGLWVRAWAPFVHTSWNLHACETVTTPTGSYNAGYFTNAAVANSNLLQTASAFFQGNTPTLGTGYTFEALKWNKWGSGSDCGSVTENGLADLRVALGWDFFQDEDYHIGLGLLMAAPTGNRPEGKYLFEPMVGNGNSWELGGLLTSHVIFWRSEDEEKHLGGYLDANVTHLFKTRQRRAFDLCGKPMSRYMLAAKMQSVVTDLAGTPAQWTTGTVTATAPSAQFANGYAPVANLTTSDVHVSVGVQADVVAMLNYTHGGFSFDLGYNFWARSCEKIDFDCDCLPRLAKETNTWVLKGDAYTYGFANTSGTSYTTATALSASESNATIFGGTNAAYTTGTQSVRNFGVDNAQYAQNDTSVSAITNQIVYTPGTYTDTTAQTQTSVNPVFLTQSNINLKAGSKALSNSVFGNFSYSWLNNEDWTPFLGIGAQAEFGSNSGSGCGVACSNSAATSSTFASTSSGNTCSSCCSGCKRCAVSSWFVWVKGGIAFN